MQPIAMRIEVQPMVQKVEKYYSKGKIVYEFVDRILQQGSQLITIVEERIAEVSKMNLELDKTLNILFLTKRKWNEILIHGCS